MITDYVGCVNGIEECVTQQFNSSTFQAKFDYNQTLGPGFGCYLEMTRTLNGSWGQVRVNALEPEDADRLLVFDDDDRTPRSAAA